MFTACLCRDRAGRRQCLWFLNQRLVEGHDPLVPLRAIVAVVERLALARTAGRHAAVQHNALDLRSA